MNTVPTHALVLGSKLYSALNELNELMNKRDEIDHAIFSHEYPFKCEVGSMDLDEVRAGVGEWLPSLARIPDEPVPGYDLDEMVYDSLMMDPEAS